MTCFELELLCSFANATAYGKNIRWN